MYGGAIPYGWSYLFVCRNCGWWYVRERAGDAETSFDADYIIVGLPAPEEASAAATTVERAEPWRRALADKGLYKSAADVPNAWAVSFPVRKPKREPPARRRVAFVFLSLVTGAAVLCLALLILTHNR
jgi:hypothetical protein